MLMRPKPKMLNRLPRILRTPQQHTIRPLRRPQRQLIDGQTLASSLLDPSSCCRREAQGRDRHLGDSEQACVICDGADYDEDFGVLGCVRFVACKAREGDWGPVYARGEEAAEKDAVEVAVGAACVIVGG